MNKLNQIAGEIEELDKKFREEGISKEYKKKWNVDVNVGIWATGRKTAQMLHDLVLEHKPRLILELGTSIGYSTLFLADAAKTYGGRVVTIEWEKYKIDEAKEYLRRADLDSHIQFICNEIERELVNWKEPVDFVFFDANKRGYLDQLKALEPFLTDSAVIVADNISDFSKQTKDFVEYVAESSVYKSEILDIDHGVLFAFYYSV